MKYDGFEIILTRRRYGKTTFTWIQVKIGGDWQSTCDPLPKLMPSKADLSEAVGRAFRRRKFERRNPKISSSDG